MTELTFLAGLVLKYKGSLLASMKNL